MRRAFERTDSSCCRHAPAPAAIAPLAGPLLPQDLKLSNILISMDGAVKLTDFGMSKELADSLALAKTFRGTSTHMAPERIRHASYSFPADIWSLGVCLLECATGKNPYGGHDAYIATCDAILSQETPRALGATGAAGVPLSAELDALVGHCLHKDPDRRVPADILIAAPWLARHGVTSLSAARERVRVWIDLLASRGPAAANAHAHAAAAAMASGAPAPGLPDGAAATSAAAPGGDSHPPAGRSAGLSGGAGRPSTGILSVSTSSAAAAAAPGSSTPAVSAQGAPGRPTEADSMPWA